MCVQSSNASVSCVATETLSNLDWKEQEHQKTTALAGTEARVKRKSAAKIWNRKSVASVQAGDKSAALHTQTQGLCGWVTPSSPGALTVAVFTPLAGSGPQPVTQPCTQQIQGPDTPSVTPGVLRGFVRVQRTDGPLPTGNPRKNWGEFYPMLDFNQPPWFNIITAQLPGN